MLGIRRGLSSALIFMSTEKCLLVPSINIQVLRIKEKEFVNTEILDFTVLKKLENFPGKSPWTRYVEYTELHGISNNSSKENAIFCTKK